MRDDRAYLHTSKLGIFVAVVHWPAAFEPGNGLLPPHPTKEGEVQLDLRTSLVDTWKTMIKLKETGKVSSYVVTGVQAVHLRCNRSKLSVFPTLRSSTSKL